MDNIILMPIYDCYYMINTKTSKLIDGRGIGIGTDAAMKMMRAGCIVDLSRYIDESGYIRECNTSEWKVDSEIKSLIAYGKVKITMQAFEGKRINIINSVDRIEVITWNTTNKDRILNDISEYNREYDLNEAVRSLIIYDEVLTELCIARGELSNTCIWWNGGEVQRVTGVKTITGVNGTVRKKKIRQGSSWTSDRINNGIIEKHDRNHATVSDTFKKWNMELVNGRLILENSGRADYYIQIDRKLVQKVIKNIEKMAKGIR